MAIQTNKNQGGTFGGFNHLQKNATETSKAGLQSFKDNAALYEKLNKKKKNRKLKTYLQKSFRRNQKQKMKKDIQRINYSITKAFQFGIKLKEK